MDTRLSLRRRLLRIDDSHNANLDPSNAPVLSPSEVPSLNLKSDGVRCFPIETSMDARHAHSLPDPPGDYDEEEDDADSGAGGDDDGGEDECEDDFGEEEEDSSGGGNETNAVKRSDKCETSLVVKLLFSRHDSKRNPIVCFDYPPHLHLKREYVASDKSVMLRVVAMNAQDCAVYYKTHWERNCVKNAFAVAGVVRTKKKWAQWSIAWAKHIPRTKFKHMCARHPQVFNHFPDPWIIGRKDRLMKTLTTCRRRFGQEYNFFPEGFTLPDQFDAFRRALQRDDSSATSASSSLWILKPPAAACGRGIRVITAKDVDLISKKRTYVVQRYLANPLLMDGYKFDLRIYVVVTSVDPLRIYLFQEGITRFCTSTYSIKNLKNRFRHLTNYSINKKNENFVENANALKDNVGSKWSMTALFEHLEKENILKDPESLKAQIRAIICKTIIAAEAHLTPLMYQYVKKPTSCYELFGFDLMLDHNLKPWLIEVNVSPSLMGGSPLDKRVKGLLLSDIFHLVGVQVPLESIPVRTQEQSSSDKNVKNAPPVAAKVRQAQSARAIKEVSRKTTSSRSQNKQLYEIVLDPNVLVFENNHIELFSQSDWEVIYQMEDEMDRLGHFERIYPAANPEETVQFSPYFTCQRYANALCAKWILTSSKTKQRRRKLPTTVKQRDRSASYSVGPNR